MATDLDLTRLIETALDDDESLSAEAIKVSVAIGRVTLEGSVPTYGQKMAADALAASCDGVRDITNRLIVEPSELIPDEQIAANVRAAIDFSMDVDGDVIAILVRDGVVTLRGCVGSRWEQASAENAARSAAGVRAVRSSLALNRVDERVDKLSAKDIESILARVRGLQDAKITAAASNGEVVLYGEVHAARQKRTAESVVRLLGMSRVRNGIIVTG